MKLWTSSILSAAILGTFVACSNAPAPETAPVPATDSVAVTTPQKDTLATAKDRYSYALGMDMGRAIKNVDADIDKELFIRSLSDQMDGKPLLMTDEQAEKALNELVLQMQVEKKKKEEAAAQAALEQQKTFLEKNKTVEGVIAMPSGLQYKYVVKNADSTAKSPKLTDKVRVHYAGALLDGKEFDSSIKRGEPLEFPVNAVIQGWQELLTLMKEGEKVQAWIPSHLGYGVDGAAPVIPPNSLLVFEVQLLNVLSDEPAEDSIKSVLDSTQKAVADSGAVQMTAQDSIKAAKQAKADSLAAVKKAKQDSIAAAKAAKKAEQDSIKAAKKAQADSLAAVKKAKQDSIKAAKQAKADSLAAVKKAKQDSIAAAKAAKKAEQDSIKAAKKAQADSLAAVKKAKQDSIKAAKQAKADSLAAVKKAKQDSIAAAKAAKKAEQDSIKAAKEMQADSLVAEKKAEEAKPAVVDSAKTEKPAK